MKQYKTHLEAKVGARNQVNRDALSFYPAAIETLRPFIGQKVLNQGHVKSMKLVAALPKFSNTPNLSVYYSANAYSITLEMKVCVSYENRYGEQGFACYAEQSIFLGEIDHHILTKLSPPPTGLRTDYTVEEIIQARKELTAARDASRHAEYKLCYFGEHDNH